MDESEHRVARDAALLDLDAGTIEKLRAAVTAIAEAAVDSIIDEVPGYTGALSGRMGHVIRGAVQLALGNFLKVARSADGATNIAYEGIRCKGRERKLYALGHADRTWSRARNPQWASISDLTINVAQATLYQAYFCPLRSIVRDAEEARKLLKRGGDVRAGGSADMWNQPR